RSASPRSRSVGFRLSPRGRAPYLMRYGSVPAPTPWRFKVLWLAPSAATTSPSFPRLRPSRRSSSSLIREAARDLANGGASGTVTREMAPQPATKRSIPFALKRCWPPENRTASAPGPRGDRVSPSRRLETPARDAASAMTSRRSSVGAGRLIARRASRSAWPHLLHLPEEFGEAVRPDLGGR